MPSSPSPHPPQPPRLVPQHLRICHDTFLCRRSGGRHAASTASTVTFRPSYLQPFLEDLDHCPRLIDAEAIHSHRPGASAGADAATEHEFWRMRRTFQRGKVRQNYMPMWDRQAQVMLMMVQKVPRVSPVAAFRLMIISLRCTMLPRLVGGLVAPMLPVWAAYRTTGLVAAAMPPPPSAGAAVPPNSQAPTPAAASSPASPTPPAA